MARNLVVCLDGTRNEPERGATNVARIYDLVRKDASQVAYYDPGVGTMGARSASTAIGRKLSIFKGLVLGHGVKENISEAYEFLMRHYQPGDKLYLFGFSRGAYTARALAGMLRTVGLLRPGAENLIPYALKLYAKGGRHDQDPDEEAAFWKMRTDFNTSFGNPEFPSRFAPQVAFLGVWDTVKSVGWFNWRAKLQQARWPFTRKVPNVAVGRHALALDERRRPYAAYRFDADELADGDRLREVWFSGVHSDVGGQFPDDHRLSDLALEWMVTEAVAAGIAVDASRYEDLVGSPLGEALPADHAMGTIHHNGFGWWVLGGGWKPREVLPGDEIHPSVLERVQRSATEGTAYRPELANR